MRILTGKITKMQLTEKSSLAVNNFDGVHLGHQAILRQCMQEV